MKTHTFATFLLVTCTLWTATAFAASPAERLVKQPEAWFRTSDCGEILDNVLSWQSAHGDWPKNRDTTKDKYSGDRDKLNGTFDNGATTGELRLLAKAFRATDKQHYQAAFLKGLDHILTAQYDNGGWPQYFPLSKNYHRHITFNDGTMIRIMEFLRDVASDADFTFVDPARRHAAAAAIQKGIDCILRCQVVVHGKRTVWCAQHDEVTLAPANARSYELASLSGAESAGILKFLISIPEPSPAVVAAVESGVAWFEQVKIEDVRYRKSRDQVALIADPDAPPLWARFYQIETNRPFFCGRDGVMKFDIQEIESERRSGYAWYGTWGDSLLKTYAKWSAER